MAHVGQAGTKTKGRGRALWCAQCGCVWDIERVRCARCGTQNQGHLHFFNVEGDDDHRIATCDECGGYVRTVYQEDGMGICLLIWKSRALLGFVWGTSVRDPFI